MLVEGYEALAVALSAALKEFARGYDTRVVRSVDEAEALLDVVAPRLLVIDCDPPPRRSAKFFQRVRSMHPDARVLVIAAENSGEFKVEEAHASALHFMRKPFDLAEFGGAVRALLDSGRNGARGNIRRLRLPDMVAFYVITAAAV
ncbi:MAG TPA: response regulator, partial [Chthoniobacterales bacterium]|nr:response regulator [Chthoniobacterales bacterium]